MLAILTPRRLAVLLLPLVALGAARSAPPNPTYLYPAGGKAGSTIDVSAGGSFDPWPCRAWSSTPKIRWTPQADKGRFSVEIAPDCPQGVHWVRAFNDEGAGGLRPFVVGNLPDTMEKEDNDSITKAQSVDAKGTIVHGRLGKNGDVDCYAVSLVKGSTLVADVTADRLLRSPVDIMMQIVSADGFVHEQDNDSIGLDPRIAFKAPHDGVFTIRLFGFPAVPDSGIRFSGNDTYVYRLTVTNGGYTSHTVPLAVSAGTDFRVRRIGWNLGNSAEATGSADPQRSDDQAIAGTGRAVVAVVPYRSAVLPTSTPNDPLIPPMALTGNINDPKCAEFVIKAVKSKPISIRAEARTRGLPTDPVIQVFDSAGKRWVNAEPVQINTDPVARFVPPADGVYTVRIRDWHQRSGIDLPFLLKVEPETPGFEATIPQDRIAVKSGGTVDLTIALARRGGFVDPVRIEWEKPVPGITLAEVKPAGKADPTKVVVRVTAGADRWAGPIRLKAVAEGKTSVESIVRCRLADLETVTADLWLTAAPDASNPPPPPKKKR